MPWRIAPAWPVMPPPSTSHVDVELAHELHGFERLAHDHAAGLAAEELIERALVDGDFSAARLACTHAPWRFCGGRCRTGGRRSDDETAGMNKILTESRAASAAALGGGARHPRTHGACGTCCGRAWFFGSMPFTAISITRSGCSLRSFSERDRLDAADVASVMVVDLVGELAPGDMDLLGVQHDDVIAHVHVRAVDQPCACPSNDGQSVWPGVPASCRWRRLRTSRRGRCRTWQIQWTS